MIVNGKSLLQAAPIVNMLDHKTREHGVSYGLAEAGYDIRIKQQIEFYPPGPMQPECKVWVVEPPLRGGEVKTGRFTIASAIEEFDMPPNLVGIVHDKSTWARQGLSVFNTVIEPSWKGFLTLELVFHGNERVTIPAGAGIAQVIFSRTVEEGHYDGKYQHQANRPVEAIFEKG
jgi:dCTP deaminase